MKILLVSVNAKYVHKALAPWCLQAACKAQYPEVHCQVYETSINENIMTVLQEIVAQKPDAIGLSCYIWNRDYMTKLLPMLRAVLMDVYLFLGGPEVSFESDLNAFSSANAILCGEGERTFCRLVGALCRGERPADIIEGTVEPDFSSLVSPYTQEYFASFAPGELPHQLIYYESSRGCPFSCSYCLSCVDEPVRYLPLERVFSELKRLVEAGAQCIKFVDRTFNAFLPRAKEILRWIGQLETDCTFHFEVAPDLFDDEMLEMIEAMPKGRVQFEAGIQSINQEVLRTVCRKTDIRRAFACLKRLISFENCHVHVDLIAGLPGEDIQSFRRGFNQVYALQPHMLQLGFLKRLKGSKLSEESAKRAGCFTDFAPYEILFGPSISFEQLTELHQVEEVLDKFYNSGKYPACLSYAQNLCPDAYECFLRLAQFCRQRGGWRVSLQKSYALFRDFLFSLGGEEKRIDHCVRLDCLTFDAKGRLPEEMIQYRDKAAQKDFVDKYPGQFRQIRAERFEWDGTLRIFVYDRWDPVTGRPLIFTYPLS